jgi:hypothetical protein
MTGINIGLKIKIAIPEDKISKVLFDKEYISYIF